MLDLLIKNVTVVTTEDGAAEAGSGWTSGSKTGSSLGGTDIPAEDAAEVVDGRGLLAFRGRRRPPALGHLQPAGGGHGHGEPGQQGVSRPESPTCDGPVLPEPDRPLPRVLPKVLGAAEGRSFVDYAFHLAPMMREHIDEIPSIITEFGVPLVQDLHVLRQPRTAWQVAGPERLPHDPAGERYDLAHFEFVMRGIQKAREELPQSPTRSPCRCTARPRRS